MFQTMNSVRSNNLSLKYQIPSGFKDKEIRKLELVAKTQFLRSKISKSSIIFSGKTKTVNHIKNSRHCSVCIQKNGDLLSSLNSQIPHDTLYYADGRI